MIFKNEVINKKKLNNLISLTFHNYGVIRSSLVVDKIKKWTGTTWASQNTDVCCQLYLFYMEWWSRCCHYYSSTLNTLLLLCTGTTQEYNMKVWMYGCMDVWMYGCM